MGRIPREWRNWGIGAAAVLVLTLAVALPTVVRSDAATVSYHSLDHRPAPVPGRPVPAAPRALWTAGGVPSGAATATPSTVVTAGAHEIAGRDPTTGTVRWSYRRGNAQLCGWTMSATTAIAAFRDGSACTDLTGFDADTGRRLWYLNADLPASVDLIAGSSLYYGVTRNRIYGFYLDGGSSAWTFHRSGCTVDSVVSGDTGLLVIVRCPDRAADLVALDGFTGKQRWRVGLAGNNPHLLSADRVGVVASTVAGRVVLSVYDAAGHPIGTPTGPGLAIPTTRTEPPTSVVGTVLLAFDGARVVAVDSGAGRLVWSAPALGPATLVAGVAYVPRDGGFTGYAATTGRPVARIRVPDLVAPVVRSASVGGRLVVVSVARTRAFG